MNRGTFWSDKEMRTLIALWGASDIQQQLDGAVRNKVIYEKIAQGMKKKGYERDWMQCRIKIKNLKTNYKKIKDSNNKTGESRKTCKYYDELDQILGHRPASVPSCLVDTSSEEREEPESNNSQGDVDDGSQTQPQSPVGSASCSTKEQSTSEKKIPDKCTSQASTKTKKSKSEKAIEKQFESFLAYQKEAEERFERREEERWKKEKELDEKNRKEEQEHQVKMIQMLGQMVQQPRYYPPPYNPDQSQYEF